MNNMTSENKLRENLQKRNNDDDSLLANKIPKRYQKWKKTN